MTARILPSAEEIRSLLSYDPETGILTWLPRKTGGLTGKALRGARSFNARHAGTIAGGSRCDGYTQVRGLGRMFFAHRLAWLLVAGDWPAAEIDHVNGDRSDNRLVNLREATRTENGRNRRAMKNVTGWAGVISRGRGFESRIRVDGKISYLGTFSTPEQAHAAYRAALEVHGFDESHGRSDDERAARPLGLDGAAATAVS